MKNDFLDGTVEVALLAGAVSDGSVPISDNAPAEETSQIAPLTAAERLKNWRPWDDIENRDPWTKEVNLKASEQPFGLITAERQYREGIISAKDFEVIRELSGTPHDFVLSEPDSERARDLILQYVQHQALSQDEGLALAKSLALREARMAREEEARFAEEQRIAREKEEAKDREWQARAELEEKIYNAYSATVDRLNAAAADLDG